MWFLTFIVPTAVQIRNYSNLCFQQICLHVFYIYLSLLRADDRNHLY